MSIKAVIFDVGGVLLKTEDRSHRNSLEKKYELEPGGSEALVFGSEIAQAAQSGELTIHQLWDHIAVELSLKKNDLELFKETFWAGDRIDQQLIDLISEIKNNYLTAIISNYTDELHHSLHNDFKISHLFNVITVSAIERTAKPDPEIFEITLSRLNINAEEAIFIDDMIKNTESAEKLGIKAIHYKKDMDLEQALKDLGLDL